MQIETEISGMILPTEGSAKEMLSWSRAQNGDVTVRINFSSLAILQECPRKAQYSLLRKLRSNIESPATLFGSAIHRALEIYYTGDRREREIPKNFAETMQMIGCGVWEPEWEENLLLRAAHGFMSKAAPLAQLPGDNARSPATGVWMLQHYFTQYLTDPYQVMFDKEGPIVERRFSMPVHSEPGLAIEAFGQIDVVLHNEVTGEVLPGDHKTTSILGSQFYQRLTPNAQYCLYSWAANDVLGLDSTSFLVNALQVKAPPKTSRGSPPQFARQVTTRTREDYEELRSCIITEVKRFLALIEQDSFPMHAPGPCSNYGGCQYHDICSAPAQLRENIIAAKYQGKLT